MIGYPILIKAFLVLRFKIHKKDELYNFLIKKIKKNFSIAKSAYDNINSEYQKNLKPEDVFEPEDVFDPKDVFAPYAHLWTFCKNCETSIYKQYAQKNKYICQHCAFHLPMESFDRIESLIDSGTWDSTDENMVSTDPYEILRKNLASAYDEDANQNSKKSIKSEESTESEESQESEESTESEESQESEESTESEESQESEESTESEESQESEESTESEESQESEESTESEESQESINLLWMLFQKRELMLFKMISHLRKMENEEPFHTYPIEKLFTPAISGLLKESGVNTMKDLLDLKNMGILTLFFPNKERREFGREFSRLYSYFSNMDKFRKSDYSHPEDSIPFGKNDFLKSWLLNMISRLKKMGNENKFHLYPIEKWFTPGVSRILNKSSIANIKDLLDFDNLEDLILGFSNKEAREFTVEFSRLHSIFFILDKNKKDG
jgi:hypothetical protein